MRRMFILFSAAIILLPCPSHSRILNVPDDYSTIQGAINVSLSGDTVLVQQGTYHTSLYFHGHNVLLGSMYIFTGDTTDISGTIIDADTMGVAVNFISGETNEAAIVGFSIRKGRGNRGGGIHCNDSSPSISHNIIENCRADFGAGIGCWEGSDAIITDNVITRNRADYLGGGIYVGTGCDAIISSNTIVSNYSREEGGGICSSGGSRPTISNNLIAYDTTDEAGGGISCYYQSYATISDNIIRKNHAARGGGGISFIDYRNQPQITGNSIDSNTTPMNGGGILGDYYGEIRHNSLVGNRAAKGGGMAFVTDEARPTADSNEVRGNTASNRGGGLYFGNYAEPIIRYNEIIGNHAPEGGGIFSDTCEAKIKYNVIDSNTTSAFGSGITLRNSTDSISHNFIRDNSTGAGIYLASISEPVISHNVIEGNYSRGINSSQVSNPIIYANIVRGNGGGISCGGWRSVVSGNIISGNHNTQNGGGIFCNGDIYMSNNIVFDNSANRGGAFYIDGGRPLLRNNLSYGNNAFSGAAIYCNGDSSIMTNMICWADSSVNGGEIFLAGPANPEVSYCDIMGGWDGTGNIDIDPMFVNPAAGDFRLMSTFCGDSTNSPCLDVGNPLYVDSLTDCNWGRGSIYCDIGGHGGGARQGSIINVPDDIGNIQSAIESSQENDTVLVHPGVYRGHIFFDGHNVIVGSLFLTTGDPDYISQTVLDGRDSSVVVSFHDDEDSTAMLIGFTIKSGRSYEGGGIRIRDANPTITRNIIRSNISTDGGGGIFCVSSSPVIKFNIFQANKATSYWGGGGIYCSGGEPRILNNIFVRNWATRDGGGIRLQSSNAYIINNTFWGNIAQNGGGITILLANPVISNSILWQDSATEAHNEIYQQYGTATVEYSDIEGGWDGEGNIDIDPLFRDIHASNYHLMSTACGDSADSPCIDAGDPDMIDLVLDCDIGLGTLLSDMGAFGGGNFGWPTGIIEIPSPSLPEVIDIAQNYPNPFNSSTSINYRLSSAGYLTMDIYNILGQKVSNLFFGMQAAGEHKINWHADGMPSGIYFLRIAKDSEIRSMKMLLLK